MAKVTKRDRFVEIATILEGIEGTEALVEMVDAEIARIDKRKGAERKPTKGQLENVEIKESIVEGLETAEIGLTATEIAGLEGISVQKASALLSQLVTAGLVTKTEAKGKERAKFSAV